jgi:hypothetical protein
MIPADHSIDYAEVGDGDRLLLVRAPEGAPVIDLMTLWRKWLAEQDAAWDAEGGLDGFAKMLRVSYGYEVKEVEVRMLLTEDQEEEDDEE